MTHDDSLDSILSDEEVRALLGDQGDQGAAARSAAESPRGEAASPPVGGLPERLAVVLASRRRADAGLLAERLSASGVRVDPVRNAFSALDLLRRRPYGAVLTDLDLWPDGATLLFERIGELAEPPLVILLSDRRAASKSRPPRAGIAGELLCPLSPMEVEVAVEQLIASVTDHDGRVRDGRSEERRVLIGDPGETVIGGGEAKDALLASRSALALGPYRWEIPWLRFFLEAQRRLRTGAGRDALFAFLLGAGREVLGAEAAAISVFTDDGVTVQVNAAPGRSSLLADVSELLDSPVDENGTPWDGPAVFSLDVPLHAEGDVAASARTGSGGNCRLLLLGLSRPLRSAALTFRDDLRAVVVDALKRS